MSCENKHDSYIAKHNSGYYFCCYEKNAMVDKRDCEKCKYYSHNGN